MAKAFIDDTNLVDIANAIRTQNGSSDTYLPSEMADAIIALPVLDTSDATATTDDIISGKNAYVNGIKISGSLVVNNYYLGSEAPSSTIGNDGDLYLVFQEG